MNAHQLQKLLEQALSFSIHWKPEGGASNALRSSRFCSEVGKRLPALLPAEAKLFHIGFQNESVHRVPGEWLLDAVVADIDDIGCVRRVHIAMECESSTAMQSFSWDFGKLLHVKATTKIYLQGLNQALAAAADGFVTERLDLAARLVREEDPGSEWFFGFWPSPEKVRGAESLWDTFNSGRYLHLGSIRLFQFDGASFVPAT
ncbi:hypothetical protein [Shewanella sedimentimangrovi]|uniref:Uncharacterized protein n=1 Tax=Shewanella sedimentimangrovi TaxID=2814293 RepID=A0ABX7R4D4_9GAMM|nr:hypothetical protein [Shewanella sedimentimangrovi]QSX38344.1 hypothetical protein JYB85_05840 [Shewanella sedimentimangrovi]